MFKSRLLGFNCTGSVGNSSDISGDCNGLVVNSSGISGDKWCSGFYSVIFWLSVRLQVALIQLE